MGKNPLFPDRDVDFLLGEVFPLAPLLALPAFAEIDEESVRLYLAAARRLARDRLFPLYRALDAAPPVLEGGRVTVHPALTALYAELVELGVLTAGRPAAVGGQGLPALAALLASGYLMAGNLSAYAYLGLTAGAARLIESFGSPALRERFMRRMYAGEWTGTMALTEPQAGSSLADVSTRARPAGDHYLIQGTKIFISGGDHGLTANIVHLCLARIDGAPAGIKGISLFAVPRLREGAAGLEDNDVVTSGLFHKIGWRGVPSVALSLGERGDCRGWLVGQAHQGIRHMFQMMNEARLMVGMNAVATAAVAYQEALAYARERPQGRPLAERDPSSRPVPIIQHADVRRMLLRQKAVVEGGLALLCQSALLSDLAEHHPDAERRRRAGLLLDLLTPVAKTFPSEAGSEANALAIQVLGGYGYTSEFLPEALWRDQKLNTIHEGTSGIQSLDLLGRKVVAPGALEAYAAEVAAALAEARRAGVDAGLTEEVERCLEHLVAVTAELGARGARGEVERMLAHSFHYLSAFSALTLAWMWLRMATAAQRARPQDEAFYGGKLRAAAYWIRTELPRARALLELAASGEDSYAGMAEASF